VPVGAGDEKNREGITVHVVVMAEVYAKSGKCARGCASAAFFVLPPVW